MGPTNREPMYPDPSPAHRRFRFGAFLVDTREGELSRDGQRIPIQDVPFRFLVALLEGRGAMLDREQLRERIWPPEVHLDFEDALATAARKARRALGESAKSPGFIETLPGKGYRFMAELTEEPVGPQAEKGGPPKPPRLPSTPWKLAALCGALGLALAGLGLQWAHRHATRAPIASLAVLPLQNDTGDPGQAYFADAVTDALITNLAQIKSLRVISRTSAMHYKGTTKPLPVIARELGVEAILEGSIARAGDTIRITAQLLDGPQDRHLWAGSYTGDSSQILVLPQEVVREIGAQIRVSLTPLEKERLTEARRVDPVVYDMTLRAQVQLERADKEQEYRQVIAMFQGAADRDPDYAPAWAGLAVATWNLAGSGHGFVSPGEVRDRSIQCAERALALDPSLPEAHEARAEIAIDAEWDFAKAKLHFERALELRPGYAYCRVAYAGLLHGLRKFPEARRQLGQAKEEDPFSPVVDDNLLINSLASGNPEAALKDGERLSRAAPDNAYIPCVMGFAEASRGRFPESAKYLEAAIRIGGRSPDFLGRLGYAYLRTGRAETARGLLSELESAERSNHISPIHKVWILAGLGRQAEAYAGLAQAFDQRDPSLLWTCVLGPAYSFDGYLKDPRWPALKTSILNAVKLPADMRIPDV